MTGRSAPSLSRAVAASGVTQLAARAIELVVNVVAVLLILHHLGPEGFGDYVLVMALVGVVNILAEWGLPKLAVREIATEPDAEPAVLGTVAGLRLMFAAAGAVIVQLVLFGFGADSELRWAALVASAVFVAEALLTVVVAFHVRVAQQYEAVARTAGSLVKLAVIVFVIQADGGLVAIMAAAVLGRATTAVIAHALARRYSVHWRFDGARVRYLLIEALPIAPAALAGVLFLKLDALMVGALTDRGDLGVYGAAYQPMEYLLLMSAVVLQVLFPLLARAADTDRGRFANRYDLGLDASLALFLPVAVMFVVLAQPIVDTVYDAAYADAALPMALLAGAMVLLMVNAWQSMTLLAVGEQKRNLAYLVVTIGFNVVIDLALIPTVGFVGAAWGTLISASLLVAMSTVGVHRYAHLDTDWWSVSSFAAAAVVAGAVMWVVGQLTDVLLLALGAGAVAYVTAAGTLGGPALARARVALRPERVRPLVGGDVS